MTISTSMVHEIEEFDVGDVLTTRSTRGEIAPSPEADQTVNIFFFDLFSDAIPPSFWQGLSECLTGRHVDMEQALNDIPPDAEV